MKKTKKKKFVKSTTAAVPADNFVLHHRSLLENPARQALSPLALKVLECIELEHLKHGGQDNGRLIWTYSRLIEYCGIGDRSRRRRNSVSGENKRASGKGTRQRQRQSLGEKRHRMVPGKP